jgi:hypothetical protein
MDFKIITDFLSENWIPNLFGLIGGLLGLYTFIDSYLVTFKPKIYIGTSVVADTVVENNYTRLNSIICSLELCNHRKRYGVIYDFAVRVYRADEINSDKAIYYASEIVDRIPINVQDLQKQNYELFKPITVLPESNNSVNFVMSDILHRSKMDFNSSSSYYIEVYYQKKPDGKWYYIDKLYLFNKGQYDLKSEKYILFSVLNNDTTRDKLKEKVKLQKTSLYTGASQKFISYKKSQYVYRFIKYPYYRVKDALITLPFYANFAYNSIIDKFVKIPIIKRYGKNIEKGNIRFGSPESKPITEAAFEKIFIELDKLVKQINDGAKKEAEITIKKDNGQIVLSRYKLSIIFYKAGDRSIYVQEQNAFKGSRLRYNIDLRNKIWNKEYWHLENYGFITIKSFVVKVLDAFVIHSNY